MFAHLVFLSLVISSWATIGIDVSQSVTEDQFSCLKDNGYQFVIVRAHRNIGVVDWHVAQTIRNARKAGIRRIDAYFLPCRSCDDPAQQIVETIDYLNDQTVSIDRLWIDIGGRWDNRTDVNVQFVDDLIGQIEQFQMQFGIATTRARWLRIMTNSTRLAQKAPLWYSNHDQKKSFDDFQVFGGWQQPLLKQFRSDVKECGVVLNRNYGPIY